MSWYERKRQESVLKLCEFPGQTHSSHKIVEGGSKALALVKASWLIMSPHAAELGKEGTRQSLPFIYAAPVFFIRLPQKEAGPYPPNYSCNYAGVTGGRNTGRRE